MLKKLIKYTDYNGRERNENFYFSLNKAELMEMELGTIGGLQQMIQLMVDKQDIPKIIEAFKMIILKSYGEKSADGVRFMKSPEMSEAFSQTEAYSNLYMELISDANAAAAFINGIVPADIAENARARREEAGKAEETENTEDAKPADAKIVPMPAANNEPQDAKMS